MRERIGRRVRWYNVRPPLGCGRKHAMISDQIESRARNERGELLHELKRFKDDVRRSIPPAALEAVQQPAIGQQ